MIVLLLTLGLWKGCESIANKDLIESITLYEVKQEPFEQVYETRGTVESKTAIRYPIEGILIQKWVKEGDVVKEKTPLLTYQVDGKKKEMVAKQEGVIAVINEQYIEMVSIDDLWLSIQIPNRYMDKIAIEDEIEIASGKGKIVEISRIPIYRNNEKYYYVYISLPKQQEFSLYEEVDVCLSIESFHSVYKVPFDAVITYEDADYVVASSWLDHMMEIRKEEVKKVQVVGVENQWLVIQCEDRLDGRICVFSGLSLSFIQEMIAMNL